MSTSKLGWRRSLPARVRGWAAITLVILGSAVAAEEWTVPAVPEPVSFAVEAVVDMDRGKVAMLLPTARDLVATRVVPPGWVVAPGDALIAFSAAMHQRRARERALDLVVAQRQLKKRELELATEAADLRSERDRLGDELAVAEAALATLRAGDPGRVALLRGEVALAEAVQARAERDLASARERAAAGALAAVDLERAAAQAARARVAGENARADLAQAEAGDPLGERRLHARIAGIKAKLGLDGEGRPDSFAGINGRIAAQEAGQRRELRSAQERREQTERELHQAERDGWDHVPLQRLVIAGPQAHTFVFGPAEVPAPEGAQRAAAEPFTAERGWGWTSGSPLPLARTGGGGGGGRPGGARPPGAGMAAHPDGAGAKPVRAAGGPQTLVLARGRAVFRVALPDGHYTVTVSVGDQVDWDGVVVRHATAAGEGAACIVARRLDPRRTQEGSVAVDVTGGWLDLVLGDGDDKALRAPVAGIAMPREAIGTGWKPGWLQDPAVFVIGPEALRLRARVHQDLAPLLAEPTTAAAAADEDPVDAVRRAAATATVTAAIPSGGSFVATLVTLSSQPVGLRLRADDGWGGPLDLLGNEALFAIPATIAPGLRLGERLACRATLTLPPGACAVPVHLVAVEGDRSWIQVSGEAPRAVPAFRIGPRWVVCVALPAGTRLVPPRLPPASGEDGRSYPGAVAAWKSVPVTVIKAGGRIQDLLKEGSEVSAGQVLVTLYNPWMEERKDESEREKAKAVESFRLAADQRRVKNQQVAGASREQGASEAIARLDRDLAGDVDPLPLARATSAAALADDEATRALALRERATALADLDPARLAAAGDAAAAALVAQRRAQLSLVAARRGLDWLALRLAEGAWRDAGNQLAGREDDLLLARSEEQVQALNADLRLAQAMQGSRWEQRFREGREVPSPAAGRLFYRTGWNDQTNTVGKFEKDFWLWRGMTVADILDMEHLAFTAEVPEDEYPGLSVGTKVEVVFPRFNHRRVPAELSEVSPNFSAPGDIDRSELGTQPVARRRVVRVTVTFTTPPDLRTRLVPGAKGVLVLR